ncbi:MAG TPA: exosortase-associated EpsI family protein [Gemmataceae bacterium]|jgi:hypothetical protein|nr:exosortase-associated EpsI family protein [Gemmataceae bacterium]
MWRTVPIPAAVCLLIGYGLAEGLWTNRWVHSGAIESAVARLAEVPLTIGDWDATAKELSPREVEAGQIDGYLSREYVNRQTRTAVSVLIVCGRPGPIAVHSPEVCYAGAGYQVAAEPVKHAVTVAATGESATFKTARFLSPENALPDPLRIFWAWTGDGVWKAPDNPRLQFAGSPVLYKLYVVRHTGNGDASLDKEPALKLVQLLLPELQKSLFAAH